ncbi:MAG: helix-turn-helix transcriptional regulator [Nitrospirae bacterium]|nr:helix-turn-helix transcriptional regulator [Nitrospirota bacterium]
MVVKQSDYAKIFKALSNEQRLGIFMMIYKDCCGSGGTFQVEKNKTCCEEIKGSVGKAFTKVCDCVSLSRSTISHHFKELQNAGLITCEREGQAFRCRVNKETVKAIKKFLN